MKIRRVDWYPDEWLAGTIILTPEERGIYDTVINLIYSSGGSVKMTKEWPRLFNCERERLREIIIRLVDLGKITKNRLEISHKRCGIEMQRAINRIESATKNGLGGGRPTKKNSNLQEPGGLNHENQKQKLTNPLPLPHPTKEDSPNGESRRNTFDRWWEDYPHKVGKGAARKAFPKALSKTSLDQIFVGVDRYKATKPLDQPWCNPATWLNEERWLDVPASNGSASHSNELPFGGGPPGPAPTVEELKVRMERPNH